MSSENEEHHSLDQPAARKSRLSYTREFLLSLSELDVCKKLPAQFDQSLLSEFEDASLERQRLSGGLSLHSFRRTEYGSSPPTRGDVGNYSRGLHGKWESRSSTRSDRDSDSQSDKDSDLGQRYGNQSRRSWQVPEHDGLLGSGSFPRPSGYATGASGTKFRANDHYQLNRSNEPYHPPRPYKAVPHLRRETNDSLNDETFGTTDYTSEDRAEEERKRRASFELLRKEQQKAFQEKQKTGQDRRRDDFDFSELMEDPKDKGILSRSKESSDTMTLPVPNNELEKPSLPSQTPASRPLVPPGFTSTILERNFGTKTAVHSQSSQVGSSVLEGSLSQDKGNNVLNGTYDNQVDKRSKESAEEIGLNEWQQERIDVHVVESNKSEKAHNLSSDLGKSDKALSMDSQIHKTSKIFKAVEAPDNGEVIELEASKLLSDKVVSESNHDHSVSILDKLFGNALTLNGGGSPSFTEHRDVKADDTWVSDTDRSSKFAQWFLEEEKKPADDYGSGRPNDLLSYIQSSEKYSPQALNKVSTQSVSPKFPFQSSEHIDQSATLNLTSPRIEKSELCIASNINKSTAVTAVLTCEDLEKSILSERSEKDPTLLPNPLGCSTPEAKKGGKNTSIDNRASQHLLSLLQKGAGINDMIPDTQFTSSEQANKTVTSADTVQHDPKEANADSASSSGKNLTLEALFGSAFMKELQSAGATAQGSVAGSASIDVLNSGGAALPITDEGLLPSAVHMRPVRSTYETNNLPFKQIEHINSDRVEKRLLGIDNPRSQLQAEFGSKIGFDGSADIQLPEEDSLINVSDPVNLQSLMPIRSSAKAELLSPPEAPADIAEKLAALNSALRDDRSLVGGQGHPPFRGSFDLREPDVSFHNLNNIQSSSPQLHPRLSHAGPSFSLDSHPTNINPQMKFLAPEGIIHHDPPNHQFPGNMLRPPFHHPSSGLTGFDPPLHHHHMVQQMHMPGNFPPPHVQRGFPGGGPLPHSNNPLPGFMHEMPMHGLPFGNRQPNFAGLGVPPGSDVGSGGNHPEALQRLIEMELRSNAKQIHPFGAAARSQGMYGHELDMGFGYR